MKTIRQVSETKRERERDRERDRERETEREREREMGSFGVNVLLSCILLKDKVSMLFIFFL